MFLYFTLNAAKSYNTATGTQKEKHQEYLFNKSNQSHFDLQTNWSNFNISFISLWDSKF